MRTGNRGSASFAQMVRSSCPECGSRLLHWFDGTEIRQYLAAPQVDELEMWCGDLSTAECWRCARCGDFGVFI